MPKYPVTRRFERKAKKMLAEAEACDDEVHGVKPWYCSAILIESGAKVAFIGANPGGGPESERADRRLGILTRSYKDSRYNAWLDDTHWGPYGLVHQRRAVEVFEMLFGPQGREVLRSAACFNVVPIRSEDVKKLIEETWRSGVHWVTQVLEHSRPSIIICNGNDEGRSAWGVFRDRRFGIEEFEKQPVYGTCSLKRGSIARGKLAGAKVIGLPHLSYVKPDPWLKKADGLFKFAASEWLQEDSS